MRRLIFISLIILFCAIYYYSARHDENSIAVKGVKVTRNLVNKVTNSVKFSDEDEALQQTASTSQTATSGAAQADVTLDQMNEEQLASWVDKEAPQLDSTRNNTAEAEVRLQALARTLLPQQIRALKTFAVNSNLPINNRIMSAYMLTLVPEGLSSSVMADVAKTGLPDLGPVLPHSEAELKRSQELAIRYMQVDALFELAKTDANAMNQLRLLTQTAEASEVRAYAAKRLKEIR